MKTAPRNHIFLKFGVHNDQKIGKSLKCENYSKYHIFLFFYSNLIFIRMLKKNFLPSYVSIILAVYIFHPVMMKAEQSILSYEKNKSVFNFGTGFQEIESSYCICVRHVYEGCNLYLGIEEQKQILIIKNHFIVFQNNPYSILLHAFEPLRLRYLQNMYSECRNRFFRCRKTLNSQFIFAF